MTSAAAREDLCARARGAGVLDGYTDISGVWRAASDDAIAAAVDTLGGSAEEAAPPCAAVRAGQESFLHLNRTVETELALTIQMEGGETVAWRAHADMHNRVPLPAVPAGYHILRVRGRSFESQVTLLSGPERLDDVRPGWGVFLPLHALRVSEDWGVGDIAALERLLRWSRGRGARFVATLPLLASFNTEGDGASPYSPVSRLFWNEAYLNVEETAQHLRSASMASQLESAAVLDRRRYLAALDAWEPAEVAALKRDVLAAALSDRALVHELESQLAVSQRTADYSTFRAASEALGRDWRRWPAPARDGDLSHLGAPSDAVLFHALAQREMARQMAQMAASADSLDATVCLDVPLGVNPDGYDVWRFRDEFALGFNCGAPPDDLNASGQDWGFPPIHPERSRRSGYAYLRETLQTHLAFCRMLRVDHVMSLNRLYWIPAGAPATGGVYVRYNGAELFTVMLIEASRRHAVIAGEDLGTVPPETRESLRQHGMLRLFALQSALDAQGELTEPPPAMALASLNTHDMPTFATWSALHPQRVRGLGRILNASQTAADFGEEPLLRSALTYLGQSQSRLVSVSLEDLWSETRPQNVPGTGDENQNFRRRAAHRLEDFDAMPQLSEALEALAGARSQLEAQA